MQIITKILRKNNTHINKQRHISAKNLEQKSLYIKLIFFLESLCKLFLRFNGLPSALFTQETDRPWAEGQGLTICLFLYLIFLLIL